MLKRISSYAWVLAAALPLAWAAPASAQEPKHAASYLNESFVRVTDLAKNANKKFGFGYAKEANPSILAGWVRQGRRIEFTWLNLQAGVEYLLLADGDLDATDVDLEVYSGRTAQGPLVAQDVRTDRDAIVPFTARVNGSYTAKLTLAGSRNNVECACTMVLLRKNGWNLPITNLDSAMGTLTKSMQTIDNNLRRNLNRQLDIHKGDNQWAVFGGVANANESIGVRNLSLGAGDRVFIGAGDNFTRQLDMDSLDGTDRVLKSQDEKSQPRLPYIVRNEGNGSRPTRGIDLRNARADDSSVLMFAITDVR